MGVLGRCPRLELRRAFGAPECMRLNALFLSTSSKLAISDQQLAILSTLTPTTSKSPLQKTKTQ